VSRTANSTPNGNAGAPIGTPMNTENPNVTNANDMNMRSRNPEMNPPTPILTPGPTA
jgi:hypothetical protein